MHAELAPDDAEDVPRERVAEGLQVPLLLERDLSTGIWVPCGVTQLQRGVPLEGQQRRARRAQPGLIELDELVDAQLDTLDWAVRAEVCDHVRRALPELPPALAPIRSVGSTIMRSEGVQMFRVGCDLGCCRRRDASDVRALEVALQVVVIVFVGAEAAPESGLEYRLPLRAHSAGVWIAYRVQSRIPACRRRHTRCRRRPAGHSALHCAVAPLGWLHL